MALVQLVSPYLSFRGRDSNQGGGVSYPIGLRQFRRTFVNPANPDTGPQQEARGITAQASQAFSTISAGQEAGWLALAQTQPRTDPNGDQYFMDAKGMYVSVNWWRLADSQTIDDDAPAAVTQLAASSVTSLTRNTGASTFDLLFEHPNTDGSFVWRATAALPGLTRKARDTDFRLVSAPFTQAVFAQDTSPQTRAIPFSVSVFDFQVGDRVGIEINSLSPGYVIGQSFRTETVVV